VIAQKPQFVIVEFGGNDLLRALPAATTQANLDAILQKLNAAGIKILLAGQHAPLNFGQQYATAYNAIFPALASKYNLPLYPSVMEGIMGHPELLQPDGVHPTAQGVDVMVKAMAPLIEQQLTK
jgi:acyl-CoA thioesterase-1